MPIQFLKSMRHAARGIQTVFVHESNFRIQVMATLAVLTLAGFVYVRPWELILLILLCASVLTLELFNSVIERMANGLNPRLHPIIRDVKDMMAGAVLLVSLTSVVIGALIFVPYLVAILGS
ncbi:diacylglycerol kinase family protein [Candidatus Uhrbacteria bacterium]|nr:diacylglycerol kinase family protein [Candidatus Uhrbacteria bacterium]